MIIADTNEFHPLINAVAYRDAREADGTTHPIIIARATYSTTHVDNAYINTVKISRAAALRMGHYGYMVSGADAAAQGRFFANTVTAHGGLKPGDAIFCDDEEGSGNQTPRVEAWLSAAHSILKDKLADEGAYSGASFWAAHLGSMPIGPIRWIAAYSQADPNVAGEELWQFTDKRTMTGVQGPCDASIFKPTLNDWLKMTGAISVGPYRHVVGPGYGHSIDWLAESRHTTVAELITISLKYANAEHVAIINQYMGLRAALRAIGAPSPVLPDGFVWHSINP